MAAPLASALIAPLLLLFISIPTAVNAADNKPVVFIFGDSLSDVGNNNYLLFSIAKSDYPWYGIDYGNGIPTGRFTNGRTVGDIMAAKLRVPPPPPYLSLSKNSDAMLQGINFASGGAGILNETGLFFIQKLSFDDQISYFENTKAGITLKVGGAAAEKLSNEAIYLIGFGSNDYVNNYLLPFMADGHTYTLAEFETLLMNTLRRQLTRLYMLGARNVIFHGLPPMGCIPSQRAQAVDGQCMGYVNDCALRFNARLKSLLSELNSELPGARMAFADVYNIVLDLIDNPAHYGFKFSHTSCCNVDNVPAGLCVPTSMICSDRREYVFWDAYHPTDAANKVIADTLFSAPDIARVHPAFAEEAEAAPPPSPPAPR